MLRLFDREWRNCPVTTPCPLPPTLPNPFLLGHISDLLKWLEDLNWPGAAMIMSLLEDVPASQLMPKIEEALREAHASEDELWRDGLE